MGINTATLKFKNDLVALINNSGLPVCNIEMVMSSALSAVQAELRKTIESEKERHASKEKEAEKSE